MLEDCRASPGSSKPLKNTNKLIKAVSCLLSVVASVEQRAGMQALDSSQTTAPLGENGMQTWDSESILLILQGYKSSHPKRTIEANSWSPACFEDPDFINLKAMAVLQLSYSGFYLQVLLITLI